MVIRAVKTGRGRRVHERLAPGGPAAVVDQGAAADALRGPRTSQLLAAGAARPAARGQSPAQARVTVVTRQTPEAIPVLRSRRFNNLELGCAIRMNEKFILHVETSGIPKKEYLDKLRWLINNRDVI